MSIVFVHDTMLPSAMVTNALQVRSLASKRLGFRRRKRVRAEYMYFCKYYSTYGGLHMEEYRSAINICVVFIYALYASHYQIA